MRAKNAMGEKDCTLALNFGGPLGDEDNIPAKIYEQPELKQPDPSILILEAHVHANPRPKVSRNSTSCIWKQDQFDIFFR